MVKTGEMQRHVKWIALLVLAGLGVLNTLFALASMYQLIPAFFALPQTLAWKHALSSGVMGGSLLIGSELFRRGHDWFVKLLMPVFAFMAVEVINPAIIAYNVPQVFWLPTLFAFALTDLSWMLVTAGCTVVYAFVKLGPYGLFSNTNSIVVGGFILTLLVVSRVLQDKTLAAEKQHCERAYKLSLFDELTELPNRRLLMDRLEEGIKKSKRLQRELAVLFIDLDNFSEINDTLGHDKGDMLLLEAARRIKARVRESDTVARFGGDEFTVILSEISDRAAVDRIATSINESLAEMFLLIEERTFLSASIGIAMYPSDSDTAQDLLKHADQAMFFAKEAGRNRFSYFTQSLQDTAQKRLQMNADLRGAVPGNQLRVVYQPIIELSTGLIHKAEALVRWVHPIRGTVSPALFIPLAESTGVINEIGDWVFYEAVKQVKIWRKNIDAGFQISVNKSPAQFRNNIIDKVPWRDHLSVMELPGDAIVLEITEGLLLEKSTEITNHILSLRAAGISISLDDFGTGYSALSYLQSYEIDYLKIDQSFVRDMTLGSKNFVLCKAIIMMAHELGMKVVAEGVETTEQRDLLVEAGCDYAQGYLFAYPMTPEDLEKILVEQRQKQNPQNQTS